MSFMAIDPAIIRQTNQVALGNNAKDSQSGDARQLQQSLLHLLGVAAVAEALGLRLEDATHPQGKTRQFDFQATDVIVRAA